MQLRRSIYTAPADPLPPDEQALVDSIPAESAVHQEARRAFIHLSQAIGSSIRTATAQVTHPTPSTSPPPMRIAPFSSTSPRDVPPTPPIPPYPMVLAPYTIASPRRLVMSSRLLSLRRRGRLLLPLATRRGPSVSPRERRVS